MAAKTNVTTSAQFTTSAREVDFVSRFADNWDALRNIMGIMRPIRKAPGTKLVSYKASVDGGLKGGTVAEGDEIPFTKMKVEPVARDYRWAARLADFLLQLGETENGKAVKAAALEGLSRDILPVAGKNYLLRSALDLRK